MAQEFPATSARSTSIPSCSKPTLRNNSYSNIQFARCWSAAGTNAAASNACPSNPDHSPRRLLLFLALRHLNLSPWHRSAVMTNRTVPCRERADEPTTACNFHWPWQSHERLAAQFLYGRLDRVGPEHSSSQIGTVYLCSLVCSR